MSDPGRLRGGGAATTKKATPAPSGLSALSRLWAALSLGRIVLINVLALGVTAAATVHVITRPSRSERAASERARSALTPVAPAASTGSPAAAPIEVEVDLDRAPPAVTTRVPTATTIDDAAGSNR